MKIAQPDIFLKKLQKLIEEWEGYEVGLNPSSYELGEQEQARRCAWAIDDLIKKHRIPS